MMTSCNDHYDDEEKPQSQENEEEILDEQDLGGDCDGAHAFAFVDQLKPLENQPMVARELWKCIYCQALRILNMDLSGNLRTWIT